MPKTNDLPLDTDPYANTLLLTVRNWTNQLANEAYQRGFLDGYRKGQGDKRVRPEPPCCGSPLLSVSVEQLTLPTHVKNALIRNGFTNLGDIIALDAKQIRCISKLGSKGIQKIAQLLRALEINDTDWELYIT